MRPARLFPVVALVLLAFVASAFADNNWWSFSKKSKFGRQEKGSGSLETEVREVAPFREIRTNISVDLKVTVGSPQKVTVTFDDNLLDNVTTEVRGKTLRIEAEGSFSSRSDCLIEITVPNLDAVRCAGSGNIEIYNLSGDEFTFDLSGSGTMQAEGKVDELYVEISGSGDVDTRKLEANTVEVSIAGSGNAVVFAAKSLDGDVSGSGDIRYINEPEHVSTHVSGSGSIRRGK